MKTDANEYFCIAMTDGSFRIHLISSAPYTNGSTTIRVSAEAAPADLTKAIMKAVRQNEKEHARYLVNLEKEKARKKALRNEILSWRSPGHAAGVADAMEENGDFACGYYHN